MADYDCGGYLDCIELGRPIFIVGKTRLSLGNPGLCMIKRGS